MAARWLPVLLLWLQTACLGAFLFGFFPIKSPIEGSASWEDLPDLRSGEEAKESIRYKEKKEGELFMLYSSVCSYV